MLCLGNAILFLYIQNSEFILSQHVLWKNWLCFKYFVRLHLKIVHFILMHWSFFPAEEAKAVASVEAVQATASEKLQYNQLQLT